MAPEQRRQALLAVLAIILAGTAVWLWQQGTSTTAVESQTASNVGNPARAKQATPALAAPVVRLDSLESPKPEPGSTDRNLFRFKPKAAPPPPPPVAPPKPVVPVNPPTAATGVPPITLKFIGMWELSEQKRKIAMLTDGKGGVPIYGAEGDVVEGRYKILKIGVESIELAYLDGRGRQTIRLSGQ